MFLKKITDIKISNYGISVTRDATISTAEIEEQVKLLNYSGRGNAIDKSAENAKLPPFIQVFYYLFFRNLRIPEESMFCETYIEWLGGINDGYIKYQEQTLEASGVEYRLKRTYPSLIRDLHFLYLLQESKRFDSVDYSMNIDYYNGLDLKICYKGKDVFVSLFIDTGRGVYYKHKKKTRHDYSTIHEFEFNVTFDSLTKFGEIYLLNNKHVDILEERIKEKY